jgi:hypothetical protein
MPGQPLTSDSGLERGDLVDATGGIINDLYIGVALQRVTGGSLTTGIGQTQGQ